MEKKVIILAPLPPAVGGIAIWTSRMMCAQLKNDWKVSTVDEKLIGKRNNHESKTKRNTITELIRCLNIWKKLSFELKDEKSKVVHSCIPSTATAMLREYVCALITHRKKRKFIVHFRCTVPNTTKGKLGCIMLKKLCDISDLIIVLNNQSLDFVKKYSNTETVLIPNFVDLEEIKNDKNISKRIETAVYVGNVTEAKGCLEIIKVANMFPDIQFRLVGNAEDSIIREARKVKNVVLTGVKDKIEVKKELEKADVFLFLSHYMGEGFSNALAEAMAYGLPCIVTEWAANKDMIEDKGGIVIPVGSCNDLYFAINKLSSIQDRKDASRFNIHKVLTEYSSDVILDKYVNCYESII